MWHLLDDPLIFWVRPGEAFPRLRIFDKMLLIPNQLTDIKVIAENPGAAGGMTPDGGIAPRAAAGTGYTFGIEGLGNPKV